MSVDSTESPLFRSADCLRRHVFLTGSIHCGKSTIIRRVLNELNGNRCIAGFSTFFSHDNIVSATDKSAVKKKLYIAPYSNHLFESTENQHALSQKSKLIAEWSPEQVTVYTGIFNHYGVTLLYDEQQNGMAPDIIVMDECGRFEADAREFKSAIFTHLQGTIPVFGIIRKLDYPSWLDLIKNHPNVSVIEVSKEDQNHNEICTALVTHFQNHT